MSANSLGIERLLVVVNPVSTRFDHVEREVIDVLDGSCWANKYEVVPTQVPAPGQRSNAELIKKAEPNQGVLIVTGDGGVNEVVNTGDQLPDEIRTSTKYLVLPYGSGNDTTRSLHGGKGQTNFLELLDHGTERVLDLIDVAMGEQSRVAVSYVGLGWTALGSEAINQPEERRHKKHFNIPDKALDAITLAKLLLREKFRPSFKYTEGAHGVKEASEILFSNLPSMAGGVIRVEKSKPGKVVCIEIEPEHFVRNIAKRLITQRFIGGMRGTHISERTITVEPDTVIHFDGEPQRINMATDVRVGVKPARLKFLAKN